MVLSGANPLARQLPAAVAAAQKQGMPYVYLALTAGLLVVGVARRRRQLVGGVG